MLAALENLSKEELIRLLQIQHTVPGRQEQKAREPEQENQKLSRQHAHLEQEVQRLTHLIEKLRRLAFGQKRERFEGNPVQILLPFLMPEAAQQQLEKETVEKISYERKKATPSAHASRQPLPDHLPVEEIEIHPEGDLTDMVCIGNEVTEELEYKPGSYFVRRFIRYKYAPKDKDGEGVLIGTLPAGPIEKGIAGPGLLAQILVDKYVDHLPLYRQGLRFKRENYGGPQV